jgi:hypothetical protein
LARRAASCLAGTVVHARTFTHQHKDTEMSTHNGRTPKRVIHDYREFKRAMELECRPVMSRREFRWVFNYLLNHGELEVLLDPSMPSGRRVVSIETRHQAECN